MDYSKDKGVVIQHALSLASGFRQHVRGCTCPEKHKPQAERAWMFQVRHYGGKHLAHCLSCGANWLSNTTGPFTAPNAFYDR